MSGLKSQKSKRKKRLDALAIFARRNDRLRGHQDLKSKARLFGSNVSAQK